MRLLVPFMVMGAVLLGVLMLDGGVRRADLVLVNGVDVFTLDPQRMSYTQDLRMARAFYEGLVRLDPHDCTVVPGVAESWSVSEDGRTYRFHLREDARWSNGDPVTADDFVYAWRRAILPDTAADYSGLFLCIDGAEEFFRWRSERTADLMARRAAGEPISAETLWEETERRFDETVGVRAIDPRTLEVRLVRPVAYFLDLVAFGIFSPVHRATVERFTALDPESGRLRQDHGWTRPGTLVSNGPYLLGDWRYKRDMRLERNDAYWNAGSVSAETVVVRSIEDPNTAVLAFDAGGIDWITNLTAEYRADMLAQRRAYEDRYADELERLKAAGLGHEAAVGALPAPDHARGERRNVRAFDAFGTDFFSFNCRDALADGGENPFADARVRRAFALAVDKESLVRDVTRLNERVSGSLVPAGSIPGYTPPAGLPYDPALARATLAEAGWEDRNDDGFVENDAGERFPTIDLLYSTGSPRYEGLSLAMRDMWQRHLGVQIELRAKESKFYKDDLKKGNFMIARGGWYGDYGDPTTFLDLSRTGDGNNDRGFSSAAVDAMLADAEREVDPARRMELLAEVERVLVEEELPILPLCTFVTIYMYEPGVLQGLTEHPRLDQFIGQLSITPAPLEPVEAVQEPAS